jgi:hypothetical protein
MTSATALFLLLGCAAAACTSSGGTGGSGDAGAGGNAGGAGGAGPTCDGTPEQWCGYDYFCDAPASTCPGGGVAGTCAPRPNDCTGEQAQATCACDGQIYVNACEAYAVGVDVGSQEGCQAPGDPFACGPVLCTHGTTYCESVNAYHQCKPLPEACGAPGATCDCLDAVLCFSAPGPPSCEKSAEGDFFVSCSVTE